MPPINAPINFSKYFVDAHCEYALRMRIVDAHAWKPTLRPKY